MGTSRTVVHYASGDNRDYEFEWSKAVLEYLEKGYPAEEKNCELEVGSTTYKVLKRDTVTAFYDADGNTLFDVTNDRLKEEYEAMESLDETEPKSEIGRAIAVIEKQAFDKAVYMGKTSLADIVTGNIPDPTPEEVQKAMEEQAGTEEAEGDEPSDDSCNQDIEETHDTEAQEVSEKGGEEEKADPEPTAKGIDGAVTKLQGELKKAKEGYAEPILSHMIDRCKESETLADAVCQTHKTWEKCFKYIMDQARKLKSGNCAIVKDSVVYEWAEDYYRLDDKALEEKKAKEEKEREKKQKADHQKRLDGMKKRAEKKAKAVEIDKAAKEAPKLETKPEAKADKPKKELEKKEAPKKRSNELEGQMDLFSMMGL